MKGGEAGSSTAGGGTRRFFYFFGATQLANNTDLGTSIWLKLTVLDPAAAGGWLATGSWLVNFPSHTSTKTALAIVLRSSSCTEPFIILVIYLRVHSEKEGLTV